LYIFILLGAALPALAGRFAGTQIIYFYVNVNDDRHSETETGRQVIDRPARSLHRENRRVYRQARQL
jgi:hypothetical protein